MSKWNKIINDMKRRLIKRLRDKISSQTSLIKPNKVSIYEKSITYALNENWHNMQILRNVKGHRQ